MIKKLTLVSVMAILCLGLKAQDKTAKPLTIGDYLPEIKLFDLINYKTETAFISDFKGKWLILDFWGPACKSCLEAMPRIDSLQKAFHESIQIIMVTDGPADKIGSDSLSRLFSLWEKRDLNVPTIPVTGKGNELLGRLFPHEFIPHYVWINKWGKICAITTYHLMNAETIKSFLQFNG